MNNPNSKVTDQVKLGFQFAIKFGQRYKHAPMNELHKTHFSVLFSQNRVDFNVEQTEDEYPIYFPSRQIWFAMRIMPHFKLLLGSHGKLDQNKLH